MTISLPPADKQTFMYGQLVKARETMLHDALSATLADLDPVKISEELGEFAPAAGRTVLAQVGIRDEEVFAVPLVLTRNPALLGYYRLLTGISKKQFYTASTGLTGYHRMEEDGVLSARHEANLPDLCRAMNAVLSDVVQTIGSKLQRRDIDQLPILTLGVQFDGSHRNGIGAAAAEAVFTSIKAVVRNSGIQYEERGTREIALTNAAGRLVTVALASDPDVVIREHISDDKDFLKVAIEIKGGLDASNAHNRAGEAEKSHQKVRNNAGDFWTIISLKRITEEALREGSPTTRHWFDVTEVTVRNGPTWEAFVGRLSVALGITLAPTETEGQ